MERKWWHGLNPQGSRIAFTGKKIFPSYFRGSRMKQATSRSLSPSDGGFVGNHEEPGVDSLAEQREVLE